MIRWAVTALAAAIGFTVEWLSWDGDSLTRWGTELPAALIIGADIAALTAAALAWRKPWTGIGVAISLASVLLIVTPAWQPFTAVLIACFIAGRLLPATEARLALAISAVPLLLGHWSTTQRLWPDHPGELMLFGGLWLAVLAAIWGVGRMLHRSSARVISLERSLEEAERVARVTERRAIARDLHDIVGHSLAGILLQASGARALARAAGPGSVKAQERVSTALGHIEGTAHQAMRELHRLLGTMHADDGAGTEDGSPSLGGIAYLGDLIETTRAGGIEVRLSGTGHPQPLDRSVDLAVYRCVQEGLANVMKHAGAGARVQISIDWGAELVVELCSSGGNANRMAVDRIQLSGGFGLAGLAERLASVGGTLGAGPAEDGFHLQARIPLAT